MERGNIDERYHTLDAPSFARAMQGDGVQYLSIADLTRRLLPYLQESGKREAVLTVHLGDTQEYIAVIQAKLEENEFGIRSLGLHIEQINSDQVKETIEEKGRETLLGKKLNIFTRRIGTARRGRTLQRTRVSADEINLAQFAKILGIQNVSCINFAAFSGDDENNSDEPAENNSNDSTVYEPISKTRKNKKAKKRRAPKRRKPIKKDRRRKKLERELANFEKLKGVFDEAHKSIHAEYLRAIQSGDQAGYLSIMQFENPHIMRLVGELEASNLSEQTLSELVKYVLDQKYDLLAALMVDIRNSEVLNQAPVTKKMAHMLKKRLKSDNTDFTVKKWNNMGAWHDVRSALAYFVIIGERCLNYIKSGCTVVDLGAGASIVSSASFLEILRKLDRSLKLCAVDPMYGDDSPFMANIPGRTAVLASKEKIQDLNIDMIPAYAHELGHVFDENSVALLVSVWTLDKLSLKQSKASLFKQSIDEIVRVIKPGGAAFIAPLTREYVDRIVECTSERDDVTVIIEEITHDYIPEEIMKTYRRVIIQKNI